MPWRQKIVGALAAGFFLVYLIALAPHLVHHLFEEDHDSSSCPFLVLTQRVFGHCLWHGGHTRIRIALGGRTSLQVLRGSKAYRDGKHVTRHIDRQDPLNSIIDK